MAKNKKKNTNTKPADKNSQEESLAKKESFSELESIINILNSRADLKISLKGFTDSKGPDNYNVSLSKQRVNAVKEFLIPNGIDNSRILIEALGEKNPVADNSSFNGRKLNRRVEVRFIEK